MVHHGLCKQIVEQPVIGALGGGFVDLEQRFGLGTADRLVLDRGCGQDAGTPGGVVGIQRAGKMNTAPRGGSFAGDHAIPDDGESLCRGLVAGGSWEFEGDRLGKNGSSGRHWLSSHFFFAVPAFPCGSKRVVNGSTPERRAFLASYD